MSVAQSLRHPGLTRAQHYCQLGGLVLLQLTAITTATLCITPWTTPSYTTSFVFLLDLLWLWPWVLTAFLFFPAVWFLSVGEQLAWLKRLFAGAALVGCVTLVLVLGNPAISMPLSRSLDVGLLLIPSVGLTLLAVPAIWLIGGSLVRIAQGCEKPRLLLACKAIHRAAAAAVALDLAWRLILLLDWTIGLELYLGHRNAALASIISRAVSDFLWFTAAAFVPLGIVLLRSMLKKTSRANRRMATP